MTYTPFTWQDDVTPVTATRLNAIESGLAAVSTQADFNTSTATAANTTATSASAAANAAQTTANSALANANTALSGLGNPPIFFAPAPSGGDDTAALMAAAHLAAQNRGELVLAYGQYNVSQLVLDDAFDQPLIRGRGSDYTTIAGISSSPGSIVKFRGGSGALSGGGLRDLAIKGWDNGRNDGVELSGCGHVLLRDLQITNVNSAVVFHNEDTGDFTEFCEIRDSSVNSSYRFLLYKVDNGVESFHGSGSTGNNVLNLIGTGPAVQMLSIALPYNAPLNFTWFKGANQWMIQNDSTASNRHASFYGHINIEGNAGAAANTTLVRGNNKVLFNGDISWLGSGSCTLGNLYLMNKITYEGGFVGGEYKPVSARATLKNTPTQVPLGGVLLGGESGLMSVHIIGGNYDKAYVLVVYQSPYNDTGTISQIAVTSNIDNAGIGDPTFGWSGYGLYISNSKFTNSQVAHAKLTPLGGANNAFLLAQNGF